jgi:hypothetical protein
VCIWEVLFICWQVHAVRRLKHATVSHNVLVLNDTQHAQAQLLSNVTHFVSALKEPAQKSKMVAGMMTTNSSADMIHQNKERATPQLNFWLWLAFGPQVKSCSDQPITSQLINHEQSANHKCGIEKNRLQAEKYAATHREARTERLTLLR